MHRAKRGVSADLGSCSRTYDQTDYGGTQSRPSFTALVQAMSELTGGNTSVSALDSTAVSLATVQCVPWTRGITMLQASAKFVPSVKRPRMVSAVHQRAARALERAVGDMIQREGNHPYCRNPVGKVPYV